MTYYMPENNQLNNQVNDVQKKRGEHPIRKLLIFQVKLAVDAIRDILLSPIAILVTLADLIEGKRGKKSYFERLMKFGRMSETHVNLFEQYSGKNQTVDKVLSQVEAILVKEYKDGDISAKAKATIENRLKAKFKNANE